MMVDALNIGEAISVVIRSRIRLAATGYRAHDSLITRFCWQNAFPDSKKLERQEKERGC